MLTTSLERISKFCRSLVDKRPDLVCWEGSETVSIARPRDSLWLEIEQAPRDGLDERIALTEYLATERQVIYAGSSWEAITTITQRFDKRRR